MKEFWSRNIHRNTDEQSRIKLAGNKVFTRSEAIIYDYVCPLVIKLKFSLDTGTWHSSSKPRSTIRIDGFMCTKEGVAWLISDGRTFWCCVESHAVHDRATPTSSSRGRKLNGPGVAGECWQFVMSTALAGGSQWQDGDEDREKSLGGFAHVLDSWVLIGW